MVEEAATVAAVADQDVADQDAAAAEAAAVAEEAAAEVAAAAAARKWEPGITAGLTEHVTISHPRAHLRQVDTKTRLVLLLKWVVRPLEGLGLKALA